MKELASEVIAALDRDDRMAVEAALAAAIQQAQRDATEHCEREAITREVAAITKARDVEAAKTPAEREADPRRTRDAELDQAHQEQDRGRQRTI